MPPAESGKKLTAADIELIGRWIKQGADWQSHWSFRAPTRPQIPAVKKTSWPRESIDYFVLARLEQQGREPSPVADQQTLIRRVSLDLTGVVPTLREVEQFMADESSAAYERLVDRLLSSSRYGERMALSWMDVARYADTHGYHEDYHREMWSWREWVINAFNANMPYDRFTIEQLAGDLLPNPTNAQLVATGFNRNHGVTASGIAEEYRVEYVLDRVRTTSMVWLGLTMQCGQCHDHKFDPITQRDFYRFFAFFNTISDKGVENRAGNVDPLVKVVSPRMEQEKALLGQQIIELQEQQASHAQSVGPALAAWEQELAANSNKPPEMPAGLVYHYPLDATSGTQVVNLVNEQGHGEVAGTADWAGGKIAGALRLDGKTHVDLGDAARFERTDPFSYGAWVFRTTNGGTIVARMDDAAAYRGWDVIFSGSQIEVHMIHKWPENALHGKTKESIPKQRWTHLFVSYDGSSRADGFHVYFDGKEQEFKITHDTLSGTIQTDKPLHIGRRNPSGFFQGSIDDVRIYDRALSAAEVATLAGYNPLESILAIASEERSSEQQELLRKYYLENHDERYQAYSARRRKLEARDKELDELAAKQTVMVMQEMLEPRSTFVLTRGQYDQHGEEVSPGTPEFLPVSRRDEPANRLGLARWLVDPANPLTGRVAVNRIWQMLFGRGIVATSEDFGTQGELPTHPELLDWLAMEFVERDWDLKRIIKQMVMSATYRQSSRISPESLERDPQNLWLARGARFRLPAEIIRDNALSVSGLLLEKTGGPSVKPYQPAGLWKETSNRGYEQDHGEKLYRRSLYTYWKRSVPPPNMFAIDAPTRETCTVQRQRTNTPLMALVILNDPTFVEASRALARRAMIESGPDPREKISFIFRSMTSRSPSAAEMEIVLEFFRRQQGVYSNDKAAALKLLAVGESKRLESLDAADHAAWTTVASMILNMDEAITRE